MKTKTLNGVRIDARNEFVKFFSVEKQENTRKNSILIGLVAAFFSSLIVLSSGDEEIGICFATGFLIIALISLIIFLFLRKSLIQVRRMMKEFKGVDNAKKIKNFLVRNEQFRDIPFFSQELARFIMKEDETYSLFPQAALNLLNDIFSYLEKKGLEFKFERSFLDKIFLTLKRDKDFPSINIIVVGEKEKVDNIAKVLKEDYSVKNQKEPLFARFIEDIFGKEESNSLVFKITEIWEKADYFQEIYLDFPGFYENKHNV